MIRADWATPPDGDFARYVDQLMARAAQARLQASAVPVEGFDGASRGTGSVGVAAAVADPLARRTGVPAVASGPARIDEPRTMLAETLARGLRHWASSTAGDRGWRGWLQERVRIATTPAVPVPPTAGRPGRLYDPRVDRSPRKQ